MALRRSARLSAVTNSVQPTIQAKNTSRAQQTSGVTKARKTPAKGKKTVGLTLKRTLENPAPSKTAKADTTKQEKPNNIFDPLPTDRSISRLRSTPPPLDRPVELHRTNATLLTPHGSSLVAYPPGTEDASPSKTGRPRPTATTGTLLEKAVAHLIAADSRLEPVIKQHPCPLFSPEGLAEEVDPFRSLVVSIIGQQVSGAAAKSIKNKFVALFNSEDSGDNAPEASRFPKPEEIIKCDIATLRTAGLSQRKAEYIQGLSQKFASGELSARMLLNASDEELLEKLTAVRGLGKWSVEMFACFALKRIDVFSTGDLGVQRGCAAFMGKDVSKLKAKGGGKFKYMAEKDMLELAAKFAPYRSLFMWYMWRVEGVDIAVLTT
ncbi:DNA glycosylase [Aspergillus novoparasiticus]|uniref:DNA glycosylase n=1 Tax=Aspergillus novoparasiticus TaxID=986946 RepID=A0A5N6EHN4_9EURO|nr:DNA glycosylase [Aspergillus novoparasiticus]